MYAEPLLNDPNDPLVSILIFNYDGRYLATCLEQIFHQDKLPNIEVIYVDDATNDGAWETAVSYGERYGALVTLSRNRRIQGPERNRQVCRRMARGCYCTILTGDMAFRPAYLKDCVRALQADPHAHFDAVWRVVDKNPPAPSVLKGPLVSVLCYNYNYGRFLRRSLESIFSQTYQNIEVCFSDNASTDDSWKIALEFSKRYPSQMYLTRNRKNFGADVNFANCYRAMEGKYFVNFCSDDAMEPEYVARCVQALEAHPHAGMAIVNRVMIDENERRAEEPPFYSRSCVIPGTEQAAVYMMAGVNPSVSQIMYRRSDIDSRSATGLLAARYYGTRILDFNISLDYDVIFIKEGLLLHRIHGRSDTQRADENLMPVVGMYVLTHQLAEVAALRGLEKASGRLPGAIAKLARLAIRYSVRCLQTKEEHVALKYFHLALALDPRVVEEPVWQEMQKYWSADGGVKAEIVAGLGGHSNLAARSVSYDPPPGSLPL